MKKTKISHPDAELIGSCIEVATALRGTAGAFEADPTGDNDFAAAQDDAALKRASQAMHAAANYLPSTFDGLRTKAAIVDMVFEIDRCEARAFVRSLADDVIRFHKVFQDATKIETIAEIVK
jgi:hypothetical protein